MRERDAFSGGAEEADVADGFGGLAELRAVADHDIVAGFAVADLGDGGSGDGAADGSFDGGLNVGDVDAEASGSVAVYDVVEVGLADDVEDAEVGDAGNGAHDVDDLIAFGLEGAEVVAVEFDGEFALDPGDGFFDVVGDGLRKVPDDAGGLFEFAIHGGDEGFLVFVEGGAPLAFGFEVDEVFGVEEAGGVGAVVGAAGLGDDLGDLGEAGEDDAGVVGDASAGGGAGAGGE